MKMIYEVVAKSFKNGLKIVLIFIDVVYIKCYQLKDKYSIYFPVAIKTM